MPTTDKITISMKKLITLLIALGILAILFMFYWQEIRPARIKHDCSWVKEMVGYEQAKPAMSEKELLEKGILKKCGESVAGRLIGGVEGLFQQTCSKRYQDTIEAYKVSRAEIPAKERWRESTDIEYKFCLRDKGL